jgi:acyl dehydratase
LVAPDTHAAPLSSDSLTLDKSSIVAFASHFDPQPYHLDREAAEQSIFGGLCASGWHIAALATRLVSETLIKNGLPFVELLSVGHLKWTRPTFVDEEISVRITLTEILDESPIAETYIQVVDVDVCNGDGAVVATMSATAAIAQDSDAGETA